MNRHWDVRGKSLDQVMTISAEAFDEALEEMIDNAGNLCRDHGGTEDEVESAREMQRQSLMEVRDEKLIELRRWLERGCESLQ